MKISTMKRGISKKQRNKLSKSAVLEEEEKM